MQEHVKTSKGAKTRARILAEARTLLVAEGYDAVTLREVAKRAELRLGNLQYYFATRDDLLMALVENEAQADIQAVERAFDASGSAEAALKKAIRTLLDRWTGDSGIVFATLTYLATHKPAFRSLHDSIYARFHHAVESALRDMTPGLPTRTYRERARLLTALIDGAPLQLIGKAQNSFFALVADHGVRIALSDNALT